MPSSNSKSEGDLATLRSTVSSISALLAQLQSSPPPTSTTSVLSNPPPSPSSAEKIDPLALAHDSASLIKAQTTKISLLLISAPFTPLALTPILRALSSGALPGLASSMALCAPGTHTRLLSAEMHARAMRVFAQLAVLVAAIPLDGSVLKDQERDGGRGSLAGTGAVWDACDEVMALKGLGVAGVCVKKVESWRELVRDALEELREWGEEEGSDEDDDEDDVVEGEGKDAHDKESSAQDMVDSMFNSPGHIPCSDPDQIRPRLDTTVRRLRLLVLLYTALVKRRFKTLPPTLDLSIIGTLDSVLDRLKNMPDVVDELASAFYDLDQEEIDTRMRECFGIGKEAAERAEKDWKGGEDEFTTWAAKFKTSMDESW